MTEKELEKAFQITSVSREDILSLGYSEEQVSTLSDADMEDLAERMGNDYINQLFFDHLKTFVDAILKT